MNGINNNTRTRSTSATVAVTGSISETQQHDPKVLATKLINYAKGLDEQASARMTNQLLPPELVDIILSHPDSQYDTKRCHNQLFKVMMSICDISISDAQKLQIMSKQFNDVFNLSEIQFIHMSYCNRGDNKNSWRALCTEIIASFTVKQLELLYLESQEKKYSSLMQLSLYQEFAYHIHLSARLFIGENRGRNFFSRLIDPINNLSKFPFGLHVALKNIGLKCKLMASIYGSHVLIKTFREFKYQFGFILSRAEFEAWKIANLEVRNLPTANLEVRNLPTY